MLLALALGLGSLANPAGPLPELVSLETALQESGAAEPHASPTERLDARTALALAAASWRAGRFAEAAKELETVAPDPLLGPFVALVRADSLFYGSNPAEAAPIYASVAAGPVPVAAAIARRRWAEAELAAGHWARAAELLQALLGTTVRKAQGSAALLEELGRALSGAGNKSGAADAWRQAWLQDPDDSAAQTAHDELVQIEGTASHPASSPATILMRAKQLLRAGHPEAAHSDLAEEEAEVPAGSLQAERGQLFMAQADRALGNDDEALAHWQKASASSDPAIATAAKIALARLIESRGEWEQAVSILEKVAAARRGKGEGSEAQYLSAWILLQHGKEKAALAGFADLAAHPKWRHSEEALWWQAWALYGEGRFEDSAEDLERLAQRSKTGLGPQALYWAARAWGHVRQPGRAAAALAKLQASAPDSFYAVLTGRGARESSVAPAEGGCNAEPSHGLYLVELQRAGLLWALGYGRFVPAELDLAAKLALRPQEIWTVAQADAVFGQPGRAFALLSAGRAVCAQGGDRKLALFPRPFRADVQFAADSVGIDPLLVWSVMRQESRFRTDARSAVQAAGAMQLLDATLHRIAKITGIPRVDSAGIGSGVSIAAWYLRALSERFDGNPALVAAAYNAGPEAVASWVKLRGGLPLDEFIERIPYRETRRYVKSVLANYAGYRSLFGSPAPLVDARKPVGASLPGGVAF
jgi:soluble lytic murein transglycosylase